MEKQKGMARGTDGWPGSANSRLEHAEHPEAPRQPKQPKDPEHPKQSRQPEQQKEPEVGKMTATCCQICCNAEKEPMKAFEYLKSLIESVENEWQFPKRRHRPPPLPVGPPDDNNILLFSSTQAFRIERKVDRLYPKLAELSALLSSSELAHSPAGWVTLNTLNAYTGRAVPGNFDPQSQTVVDSKPFTLTHQTTPLKLDDQLLQAILAIDDKNRARFQIGSHSVSGRKELVIRLTPSAPRSWIGAAPPQSSPPASPLSH